MKGEILSIDTVKRIADLEKEVKELKNNMYEAAEILKLKANFGEEYAQVIYSRDTIVDLLILLKVGDMND